MTPRAEFYLKVPRGIPVNIVVVFLRGGECIYSDDEIQ